MQNSRPYEVFTTQFILKSIYVSHEGKNKTEGIVKGQGEWNYLYYLPLLEINRTRKYFQINENSTTSSISRI